MGRVQLKKSNEIKRLRKKNFDYLYTGLTGVGDLIMPDWLPDADVCWFAFPLSVNGGRGELVAHLEKNGIETRSMFSGDITKHPAYKNTKYRIAAPLKEAQFILKNSFWITCHPRLKKQELEFITRQTDNAWFDYTGKHR